MKETKMENHLCPVWVGYFLLSPLRKLLQSPKKILHPYVKTGDTVLDFGSAMGFFSIPLAEMVGAHGKVICVDVQEKMLDKLRKRAQRAHVAAHITLQHGDAGILTRFESKIDFVLAFAVIHEVPDDMELLKGFYQTLKPGGHLFIAEPKGHVSQEKFARTVIAAKQQGFVVVDNPTVHRSWAVVLKKEGRHV